MSYLLAPLRETTLDRHNKAVQGLKDGSLMVTLTKQTDREVRALVKNGNSIEYGVTLTEHGTFCSCKDALYRGTVCKHAVAVSVTCLQQPHTTGNRIHLMWDDGAILCGLPEPKRFWRNWSYNALNWPDVCQPCVHAWTRPAAAEGR